MIFTKNTFVSLAAATAKTSVHLHHKLRSTHHRLIKLIVLGLIAGGGPVHAGTVTIGVLQDATILANSSGVETGNASGMGPGLFTGADGGLNIKRALIKYDLAAAGIPANSIINDVTMSLSLGQVPLSGGLSQTIRLFAVEQDWSEGSSGSPTSSSIAGSGPGYPRENGDSTWEYSNYNSDPALAIKWSDGVNDLPGGNFSATESASSTFTAFPVGSTFTWSSAEMAADAQGWLNGTSPNNGWLLKSDLEGTPRSALAFWSKDGAMANGNTALTPTLEINYSPIPEPEAYAMLLAGLAIIHGMARRRKPAMK